MNSRIRFFFTMIIIYVFVSGCTFPVTMSPDFEVHISYPWPGAVITLGDSLELGANGTSTAGDVTRVLFLANGTLLASVPNRYGGNIVASTVWTPTAAGDYLVQAGAQRGSDAAYSEPIHVCVLPFDIAPGHTIDTYARNYEGDCTIPDRSTSAVPGSPTTNTLASNPDAMTYVPNFFDTTCPDQTRLISFQFYIDDPHDDISFASIGMNIEPALSSRINSVINLALTHSGDTAPHIKMFTGQIDIHIYLARSLTTHDTGDGLTGDIHWTARAFGRDGTVMIEEGPFTIPVTPVNCDGTPVTLSSSAPIVIGPSATPATAKDCPAGTYFAEVTHRCIPIQIVTTKPGAGDNGGGGANSCSPPPGGCSKSEYWSTATCSCQVLQ